MADLRDGLGDVSGSLAEAAGYERLQLERRRGAFQLLSLLPLACFMLVLELTDLPPLGLLLVGFALVVVPVRLLHRHLRRRPAWAGVLDVEDVWHEPRRSWFLLFMAVAVLLAPVLAFSSLRGIPNRLAGAGLAALMAGLFLLGSRLDRLAVHAAWLPALTALLLLAGFLPASLGVNLALLSAGLSILAVPLFRLLAPRRWLVR